MSAPVIFRIFLRSMGIKKNRLFSVAWWGVGGGGGRGDCFSTFVHYFLRWQKSSNLMIIYYHGPGVLWQYNSMKRPCDRDPKHKMQLY